MKCIGLATVGMARGLTRMRFGGIGQLAIGLALSAMLMPTAFGAAPVADQAKNGEYLARAGDCFGCHTKDGSAPLAGGRQIQTPYGTISSPNITPDPETGIGKWSDDDFYRLMHDGIGRDGSYVYPVMPFDHYTKVTRDDVLAIKAYLFSVPPVRAPRQPSHLEFPFDIRASLAGWRALFFAPSSFQSDPSRSAQENRGAYLVQGLGHCGACHTPRNLLSGPKQDEALSGGEISGQGWFAPNITSDVREGIGGWSLQQLVDYLRTGIAPGRAVVAGPMSEVVHGSLSYLTPEDLQAIAAYLKASPAKQQYAEKRLVAPPGSTAYLNYCASCHRADGQGIPGAVPTLAGNGAVTAGGPQDLIRTILGGLRAHGTYAAMPGFATMLTARQIAQIATYVRSSWGNAAPTTETPAMVDDLARHTATMWSGTGTCDAVAPPALATLIADHGVEPMLRQIDASNMYDEIGAILAKLSPDVRQIARADVTNGLTAAYCAVESHEGSQAARQRLQQLQRFAGLVYARLVASDGQN
jgi:mono/diheme cytochrome c family protein